MEKNNKNFRVEDLVLNQSFRKWAQQSDYDEYLRWETWIKNNPDKKKIVEEAKVIVNNLNYKFKLADEERDHLRNNILNRIYETSSYASITNQNKIIPLKEKATKFITGTFWYWGAAVITLLLFGIFSGLYFSYYYNLRTIATKYGETKKIILPDHSRITLNGNSNLSFYNNWDKNGRKVWLKGEGFFEIEKANNDTKNKFQVYTGNLNIEVLGTQFNVNSRNNRTEVILKKGEIELFGSNINIPQDKLIKPGQMVVYEQGQLTKTRVQDPEQYTGWRENNFVFDGKSLAYIKTIIKNTYGLDLQFQNGKEVEELRIKGTFPAHNVEVLLQTLAKATGTSIKRKNNQVIFYKEKETSSE